MHILDFLGSVGIVAIFLWWLWRFRTIPATTCGHRTYVSGSVEIFGKHVAFRLPVKDGQTDYCLDCIGGMTILCTECGGLIVVGDAVTLRAPIAGRVLVDSNGCKSDADGRYIGCYRHGHTKSDGVGLFVIPGIVRPLPLVQELVVAEA